MKFSCSVKVNLPVDKAVELFQDVDNMSKWQDGFEGFEHLSGTAGEPGAKSKILFRQGKRLMELEETLLVNNLPEEFLAQYYHKHMTNTMQVIFTPLGANQTQYDCNVEYTKFNGFLPRMMAFLFPKMFKKQVQKWLDQFKIFAESS